MRYALVIGASRHFSRNLYSNLLRELPESGDFVEPQPNFLLRIIFGTQARNSVAHCVVHFGGRGQIETFRDDHTVVSPVLDEHWAFLGHELHTRYWALRAVASGCGLRCHGLIALRKGSGVEMRKAFGGLRRRPSRNVQKRQVGCGRGCCTRGLIFVFTFAMES
jgi:hypothetical protein